jgi:hypothetical protein
VYVSIYRPSGTAHADHGLKWVKSGLPEHTLIEADEVIVCMDARTGRTLWEAVWSGKEVNHIELYGGHNNVCVAGGRVYAIGNSGWAYCADALTGERKWLAPAGPSAQAWERFKADCIREKLKSSDPEDPGLPKVALAPDAEPPHPDGGSLNAATYNMCPVVADGVLVTGEWSRGSGLVGFDARDGRELWRAKGLGGGVVPPILWKHKGREYVVMADRAIACLEPGTGRVLWKTGQIGNTGYESATAAVSGDFIFVHSDLKAQRKLPPEEREGWLCFRLSPEGAEKVWALPETYPGSGYLAPVAHRGRAWLPFQGAGSGRSDSCGTVKGLWSWVCVDPATGRVLGEAGGAPMNSTCPGPVAMGDRLFYQGDKSVWMMSLDEGAPKYLGDVPQPVNLCSSASAADGLVYLRGAERLVTCLDVRKPAARPAGKRFDDPPNARFDLVLDGALREGGTARFHFRGRSGAFLQSWATVAPKHIWPDVLDARGLKIEGSGLRGKVTARMDSAHYEYLLDIRLAGGKVSGDYEDCYRGQPVEGAATGSMLAWARENGDFFLYWPRHWLNGQNQASEHILKVKLARGRIAEVAIVPRLSHSSLTAAIVSHDLRFDGKRFAGRIVTDVSRGDAMRPGAYRVDLDLGISNNLLDGSVRSQIQGGQETQHHAWGYVVVPTTDPVDPGRAVFTVNLDGAVRGETDLKLNISTEGSRVVSAVANAQGCAGLQKTDASGLAVRDGRVTGRVQVKIGADGYYLRQDTANAYDLDLTVKGNEVTGTFRGTYDVREPRRGAITGQYRNDL